MNVPDHESMAGSPFQIRFIIDSVSKEDRKNDKRTQFSLVCIYYSIKFICPELPSESPELPHKVRNYPIFLAYEFGYLVTLFYKFDTIINTD
jgi:hypothetical protein